VTVILVPRTLRVWSENYRLPDIQLSKIRQASVARLLKPGGEYRARTGDLLVANQALSQLS
jgi:hypothetical protein